MYTHTLLRGWVKTKHRQWCANNAFISFFLCGGVGVRVGWEGGGGGGGGCGVSPVFFAVGFVLWFLLFVHYA